MRTAPHIEFINHASVLISDGVSGVLSDPWYFGEAFHQGWALLTETDDADIRRVLANTTHLWLSHEHPDHFSPAFFKRYRDVLLERKIILLFQRTLDGRLAAFVRKLGIPVVELADGEEYAVNDAFRVRIARSDLYDSALLADIDGYRVFNLNDCPLHKEKQLADFARRYGQCDVLLTQFSYAAWKGGKANPQWRRKAARHKLTAMHRQIAALKPTSCILFANYVRFCNRINSYLNDSVNHPDTVIKEQKNTDTRLIFMAPCEAQPLSSLQQNPASLDFWRSIYASLPNLPLTEYRDEETPATLLEAFQLFQQRLLRANAGWLLRLGRRFLPLHPFVPTVVALLDQPLKFSIDILGDMRQVTDVEADIALHSSSLAYLFRNEFGFDTLFVNGCFEECRPGGFERFAKSFAIGNLNASGIPIRLGALAHIDVIRMLLEKLRAVRIHLNTSTDKNGRPLSKAA